MDDFEDRLRRFRPVGPPDDLREQIILSAGRGPSRWREWSPSIAAAAAAIVLYALAADARGVLGPSVEEIERRAVVDALFEQFDGDSDARGLTEWLIALQMAASPADEQDRRLWIEATPYE